MSRSLAAPIASPLLVDPQAPYPFQHVVGREREEAELRQWLLGEASTHDRPYGGAALITGFRGVGKTSLANKVLFDVGLSRLYGLPAPGFELPPDTARWGPFSSDALKKALTGKKPGALILPVYVEIARAITPDALLGRLVRRVYAALVAHRIGDLDPGLVARARGAYLRSLGETSIETTERIRSSFGIDTKLLKSIHLTSEMEVELAETIRQVAARLSVEEAEDEILGVFAGAHGAALDAAPSLRERTGKAGAQLAARMRALSEVWSGRDGTYVHVVLVLDELDKLEPSAETHEELATIELAGSENTVPTIVAVGGWSESASKSTTTGRVLRRAAKDGVSSAGEVVRLLKTLFSSRHVSAICIAGWHLEDEWLAEQSKVDPLLRSIFSRHTYLECARPEHIKQLLPADAASTTNGELVSQYVAMRTRGRYKDVLRVAVELDRDHHVRLLGRLGPRLSAWGTFEASAIPESATQADVQGLLDKASTLEDLVIALSHGLPAPRANAFGVDYIRALLASAVLDFTSISMADEVLRKTRVKEVCDEAAERIPRSLLAAALERLAKWMAEPPATQAPASPVPKTELE